MDIKRMSKQELDELNERAKRWREAQEATIPAWQKASNAIKEARTTTFVIIGNTQVDEGRHPAPGIEQNTEDCLIPNFF